MQAAQTRPVEVSDVTPHDRLVAAAPPPLLDKWFGRRMPKKRSCGDRYVPVPGEFTRQFEPDLRFPGVDVDFQDESVFTRHSWLFQTLLDLYKPEPSRDAQIVEIIERVDDGPLRRARRMISDAPMTKFKLALSDVRTRDELAAVMRKAPAALRRLLPPAVPLGPDLDCIAEELQVLREKLDRLGPGKKLDRVRPGPKYDLELLRDRVSRSSNRNALWAWLSAPETVCNRVIAGIREPFGRWCLCPDRNAILQGIEVALCQRANEKRRLPDAGLNEATLWLALIHTYLGHGEGWYSTDDRTDEKSGRGLELCEMIGEKYGLDLPTRSRIKRWLLTKKALEERIIKHAQNPRAPWSWRQVLPILNIARQKSNGAAAKAARRAVVAFLGEEVAPAVFLPKSERDFEIARAIVVP